MSGPAFQGPAPQCSHSAQDWYLREDGAIGCRGCEDVNHNVDPGVHVDRCPPNCEQDHPGRKADGGKAPWDLVPWEAIAKVVDVLAFGAKKYAPDNWRKVPEWKRRYWAACQRHMIAYWRGEKLDPETGLPHLAHAACCILFMLALDETEG